MQLLKLSMMALSSLFVSDPSIEIEPAVGRAMEQLERVKKSYPELNESIEQQKKNLEKALFLKHLKRELTEKEYQKVVRSAVSQIFFNHSCTTDLLPKISSNEIDFTRIFCFDNRLAELVGLRDTTLSDLGALRVLKEARDIPNLYILAEIGERMAIQPLYSGDLDEDGLANKLRSYFICKLEDRDLLVAVINQGDRGQNVLVIVDPTQTEITVESQAWGYIAFLYKRFIGAEIHEPGLPLGIVNSGNTCFANATLQSLLAMDDLNEILLRRDNCFKPNSFWFQYQRVLVLMQRARGLNMHAVMPSDFNTVVRAKMADPGEQDKDKPTHYGQQCVGELITKFLGCMTWPDIDNNIQAGWEGVRDEICDLFRIRAQTVMGHSSLQGHQVEGLEQFGVLSLPMEPQDKNLDDCLGHLFALERGVSWTPDESDALKYGIERKEILCDRESKLLNAPKYLILFLKRSDRALQKNLNHIAFPIDGLTIGRYMAPSADRAEASYALRAIIMHLGNYRGGHYTAYRRNPDNTWSYFNDSFVEPASLKVITDMAAQRDAPHAPNEFTPTLFVYENTGAVTTAPLLVTAAAAPVVGAHAPADAARPHISDPDLRLHYR